MKKYNDGDFFITTDKEFLEHLANKVESSIHEALAGIAEDIFKMALFGKKKLSPEELEELHKTVKHIIKITPDLLNNIRSSKFKLELKVQDFINGQNYYLFSYDFTELADFSDIGYFGGRLVMPQNEVDELFERVLYEKPIKKNVKTEETKPTEIKGNATIDELSDAFFKEIPEIDETLTKADEKFNELNSMEAKLEFLKNSFALPAYNKDS